MLLEISQQIHSEFIEPQIHDIDPGIHILQIKNLILKFLKLVAAVFKITFLIAGQQIVVSCTCYHGCLHAALHTALEFDVIVKFNIRPIIDHLDDIISAAYTVDTSESLYNPHRIPMNIIIDQIVTILKILALTYTVCSYQDINFPVVTRINQISVF